MYAILGNRMHCILLMSNNILANLQGFKICFNLWIQSTYVTVASLKERPPTHCQNYPSNQLLLNINMKKSIKK